MRACLADGTAPAALTNEPLHAHTALHASVDELGKHLEKVRGRLRRGSLCRPPPAVRVARRDARQVEAHLVLAAQPAGGVLLVLQGRRVRRQCELGRGEGGRVVRGGRGRGERVVLGVWLSLNPDSGAGRFGGGWRERGVGVGERGAREGLWVDAVDALGHGELECCARVVDPVLLLLVEGGKRVEHGRGMLVVWVRVRVVQPVDVRLVRLGDELVRWVGEENGVGRVWRCGQGTRGSRLVELDGHCGQLWD